MIKPTPTVPFAYPFYGLYLLFNDKNLIAHGAKSLIQPLVLATGISAVYITFAFSYTKQIVRNTLLRTLPVSLFRFGTEIYAPFWLTVLLFSAQVGLIFTYTVGRRVMQQGKVLGAYLRAQSPTKTIAPPQKILREEIDDPSEPTKTGKPIWKWAGMKAFRWFVLAPVFNTPVIGQLLYVSLYSVDLGKRYIGEFDNQNVVSGISLRTFGVAAALLRSIPVIGSVLQIGYVKTFTGKLVVY